MYVTLCMRRGGKTLIHQNASLNLTSGNALANNYQDVS